MTVHLDTSALVDALSGPRRSLDTLVGLVEQGHRVTLSSLVLYEWLRGPRKAGELATQEELFPRESIVTFSAADASAAARLYASISRARGREIDLAIAACAMANSAALWTLNIDDFDDIPGLRLI